MRRRRARPRRARWWARSSKGATSRSVSAGHGDSGLDGEHGGGREAKSTEGSAVCPAPAGAPAAGAPAAGASRGRQQRAWRRRADGSAALASPLSQHSALEASAFPSARGKPCALRAASPARSHASLARRCALACTLKPLQGVVAGTLKPLQGVVAGVVAAARGCNNHNCCNNPHYKGL